MCAPHLVQSLEVNCVHVLQYPLHSVYHTLPGQSLSIVFCLHWERLAGVDSAVGDTSAPADPTSRCNAACLASCHSRSWSCATGSTRSEAVFQWSLDGGLRVIANFGLWKSSVGITSGTYSNSGEEVSPKRWGRPTRQVRSPPGCWVQMVWSLKPMSWVGARSSSLTSSISLLATSNRTGCCRATGSTLLPSEVLTKRSQDEVILSSNSIWEPALCHSFKHM